MPTIMFPSHKPLLSYAVPFCGFSNDLPNPALEYGVLYWGLRHLSSSFIHRRDISRLHICSKLALLRTVEFKHVGQPVTNEYDDNSDRVVDTLTRCDLARLNSK